MLGRRFPNSHNQETEIRFKKYNQESTRCKTFNVNIFYLISDAEFMGWLASKLDYYPYRLLILMNNYMKVFARHKSLLANDLKEIYSFWVKNSIPSTDRRSSRDSIYVNKRKYLQEYNHVLDIEDESIFEFIKVKKN